MTVAGRPPKQTLDWAPWDTDIFFRDEKIGELIETSGWKGFGIYFFVTQLIYRTGGYFIEWAVPSSSCRIARQAGGGIRPEAVQEIICSCLRIGVFDKGLYERWGILTSRGIQTRFAAGIRERKYKSVKIEYWLLTDEETEKICPGLIGHSQNLDLSSGNVDLSAINGNLSEYKKKEDITTTTITKKSTSSEPPTVEEIKETLVSLWGYDRAKAYVEAVRFKSYNDARQWDCMPAWRYALEKWVGATINYEIRGL